MAISLSNHEDRIKKLEEYNDASGLHMEYLWNEKRVVQQGEIIQLTKSFREFDEIVIIAQDGKNLDDVVHVFLLVSEILLNKEYLITYTDPIISESTVSCQIIFKSDKSIYLSSATRARMDSVIGLKLYYNFSYNIYSLAKSISFHFFKCLINSFKGGVKEIWRLV